MLKLYDMTTDCYAQAYFIEAINHPYTNSSMYIFCVHYL